MMTNLTFSWRSKRCIRLFIEGELTDTKDDERIDDPEQDQQDQDDAKRVPGLPTNQFDSVAGKQGFNLVKQPLASM